MIYIKNTININGAIERLANQMKNNSTLTEANFTELNNYPLKLTNTDIPVNAFHFIDYVRSNSNANLYTNKIQTTLDSGLQERVAELLKNRLAGLDNRNVNNAAILVVDHTTNEILVWLSLGKDCDKTSDTAPGCKIDMVTVPRQPGSSMKPFLYSAALEKGWSPATIIDDQPYSDSVGNGIHHFHNYSHAYYGKVTMRQALGNSLNIPALHTIDFIGADNYLNTLHELGFHSLGREADFYDDGLALGNGEVTLLELVSAYGALANQGIYEPLKISLYNDVTGNKKRIFSAEATSLIANILSDPWARSLEFGANSVLNMPVQTAVKTGTSTDYRDAWAVGFDSKYLVGIWMGNVDQKPTDGVTGSTGPALALRSVLNELNQSRDTAPLYLSPKLVKKDICINSDDIISNNQTCTTRTEYFMPKQSIKIAALNPASSSAPKKPEILRPADGLQIAVDPRIPADKQFFEMKISNATTADKIDWLINNKPYTQTTKPSLMWPIERGKYTIRAILWERGSKVAETEENGFIVK